VQFGAEPVVGFGSGADGPEVRDDPSVQFAALVSTAVRSEVGVISKDTSVFAGSKTDFASEVLLERFGADETEKLEEQLTVFSKSLTKRLVVGSLTGTDFLDFLTGFLPLMPDGAWYMAASTCEICSTLHE
jgi:hypothetical protein